MTQPEGPTTPQPPRGLSVVLAVAIMVLASFVLWLATPLAWMWIGSQVEGASSLSAGLAVMFVGAVATVVLLAKLLSRLSNAYRQMYVGHGLPDPGHAMLEGVLVVCAIITIVAFTIWFLLFAGASPVPIGMQL